jgi:tripeptidyl-peptidase-2
MLKLNPQWTMEPFPNTTTTATNDTTTTTTDDTNPPPPQIRLGIKSAYELFPKKLISRVKQYRKIQFEEHQRTHALIVRKQLNEWSAQYDNTNTATSTTTATTPEQLKKKQDLEARLEFLEPSSSLEDNNNPWNDPGPIYDCIVFYDGLNYRAAIDVNEDGDFTSTKALTDYHKFYEFSQFSTVDMYNYAVNIYDDATLLSIVCDASPHGSHVAGIASAYHEDEDEHTTSKDSSSSSEQRSTHHHNVNGVAPGANIVSLKIGDTRLGSMETGTSLVRGLMEAIRLKCDVINLSYGEAATLSNSGRFHELATEAVQRYGIVFVSSAGNNGPALTTVGAPGGTCSSVLSIGAYVSPAMMEAGYSMIINNPTWAASSTSALDSEGKKTK